MPTRLAIGGVGAVAGLYGAYLWLSRQDFAQIKSAFIWLAGGAILHDAVISIVVILVAAVATRVVPRSARAPFTVGAVVLGSVTLLAVPMLGRYGQKDDNLTLLDRNYTAGWIVFAAVVLVAVVVASVVRSRRTAGGPDGDDVVVVVGDQRT